MNLASIEICELSIPFRFRYGHASAQHRAVRSILCIARDTEGNEGYGEAVPRAYVTGETIESVRRALPELVQKLLPAAASFESFQEAIATVEDAYTESVPACALCALETAITDLTARQRRQSVVDLLGGPKKSPLIYTASIGISSQPKLIALLLLYRALGLRHFKVKVGDEDDLNRVRTIRRILGSEVSLFADANAAWTRETAAARIEQLAALDVWAVEEPLRVVDDESSAGRETALTDGHFANCAWLQSSSSLPLIADESLISLRCAQRIVDSGAFRIFNIRLSKCGGYSRSSEFARIAEATSLSFSLGAMVGESPVLAMAGAAWATSHPQHLYVQGHSHRVLHGKRFVDGCPRLARGGKLFLASESSDSSMQYGSGLSIDRESLKDLTKDRETIDLSAP